MSIPLSVAIRKSFNHFLFRRRWMTCYITSLFQAYTSLNSNSKEEEEEEEEDLTLKCILE